MDFIFQNESFVTLNNITFDFSNWIRNLKLAPNLATLQNLPLVTHGAKNEVHDEKGDEILGDGQDLSLISYVLNKVHLKSYSLYLPHNKEDVGELFERLNVFETWDLKFAMVHHGPNLFLGCFLDFWKYSLKKKIDFFSWNQMVIATQILREINFAN